MIGFIVPIKPKSVSRDWDFDNTLLERTVKSICSQTDQEFRLVIVFTDFPEINYEHKNIIFLKFPFEPVSYDKIEDLDYVRTSYKKEYAERMLDKGKKIYYGCKSAINVGCNYLMAIDSDDLISNKIAAYINNNSTDHKPGWRIKKGFIYEEYSKILTKDFNIQNINGSTHIIRKDLVIIPDFNTNLLWNYNLFEAHGYTYNRIRHYNKEVLSEFPFFGVIYIVHKNNYSNILQIFKVNRIKNIVKKLLRGKYLSQQIRNEYGLYKLRAVKKY